MKKLVLSIDRSREKYLILAEISKLKHITVEDLVREYIQAGINNDFNFEKLKKLLEKYK